VLVAYSNVIHARSLGRGQGGISQIDDSKGAIVGEETHIFHPEDLENGAKSVAYQPQRTMIDVDGVAVVEKIELELRDQGITWENPLRHYPLSEGQIAVADELLSIANVVISDTEPEYGAWRGRQDREMSIAMSESARRSRGTLTFPLTNLTQTKRGTHESYEQQYGHPIDDIEAGIETFFPRR